MNFLELHAWEIGIIQSIQSIRSSFLDELFLTINLFDKTITYLVILYLVYALKNARAGIHLLWLLTIATLAYLDLKDLLGQPRPYHLFPELEVLGSIGYGFPSGAATSSSIILGFIFFVGPTKEAFNRGWKCGAVVLLLAIGLSRVYLGAHFPSDVLGGYALGFCLLMIYKYAIFSLEKWTRSFSKGFLFFLQTALLLSLFSLHPKNYGAIFSCYLLGGISAYLVFKEEVLSKKKKPLLVAIHLILGGCVLLVLFAVSKKVPIDWLLFSLSFLIGVWFQASKAVFSKFYK